MQDHVSYNPALLETTPGVNVDATMDMSNSEDIHAMIREANTSAINALGLNLVPEVSYADDTIVSITPVNAAIDSSTSEGAAAHADTDDSDSDSELFDASDLIHFNDHLGVMNGNDPMLGDSPAISPARFSPRMLPDVLVDFMDGLDTEPLPMSSGSHIRTRLFLRRTPPPVDMQDNEFSDSLPDLQDLVDLL
jgi:hypothetical protein